MINLIELRKNPEAFKANILKKDPNFDIDKLITLDQELRDILVDVEELRSKRNQLAKSVKGPISQEQREESIALNKSLKDKEEQLEKTKEDFNYLYLRCPNTLEADVPEGNKEENKVVKTFGEKPKFDFEIKNHVELNKINDWFDLEAAAQMTGSQFVFYKEQAVNLIYALTKMMLKNNKDYGFSPVLPPYLVNEQSLENASNFPKFRDQVYKIEEENLYLTPTAEVNLTNYYRNYIFEPAELPKRMTAWTSCFRREAGGYGAQERGLIRIHQFEKVELYTLCKPEDTQAEHERMLAAAENLLQKLGLHYRVSLLAAQDCSFPSAKTYDIEVWMPGQNSYYEVSSCSNCTDFQARRAKLRLKEDNQTRLINTLNGSSLALPRLIVAIMETFQQADGTIKLPEVLKKELFW